MPTFEASLRRLEASVGFLPDKPEETAASTLRALWFAAAGEPRSAEGAGEGVLPELSDREMQRLDEYLERRIGGEPLSHITGRQRFMGLEMLAAPDALVPRKETELLGEVAIRLTQQALQHGAAPLVVDVCTGSGNIALVVARRVPAARVLAADLSPQAVEMARRNALHLDLGQRVDFRAGDLLEPFRTPDVVGHVDVLTCNPPYISSAKVKQLADEIGGHEPHLAFDGGPLGIGILMRLLKEAPPFLRAGGWLAFEVGRGQGPAIVKRMAAMPCFSKVESSMDHSGDIRVIAGQC